MLQLRQPALLLLPLRLVAAVTITVSDAQPGYDGANAIDDNNSTIWHSQYNPALPLPHVATLDLGLSTPINTFTYLPRQGDTGGNQSNGNIGEHDIQLSDDNVNWRTVISRTLYEDTQSLKQETFPNTSARYVKITAYTEAGNRGPWTSAAEFGVGLSATAAGPVTPSLGKWGSVIALPLIATGAFLIPGSGTVLAFSASGRTTYDSVAKGMTNTATYDPNTGAVSLRVVTETHHDMFCPGLSLDFEGRAIVSGGNDHTRTSIYSPFAGNWTAAAEMNLKRGYQSSTTLSDGRIFVIGGSWLPEDEGRGNKNGEIYDVSQNTWTLLPGCPVSPMLTNDTGGIFRQDNHGWLFAWKTGSVFQAGPSKAMNWYGTVGSGSTTPAGLRAADGDSMCGVAVMYDAPNGKIFTAGGAPSYKDSDATSNVHLITIGAPGSSPSVSQLTSMHYRRAFHNAVVLPDGKIFVTGGQSFAIPFTDSTAVLQPELWDPDTQSFTVLASHQIPRNYHSLAILLLDGTVFTAGGGLCGDCQTNHLDAEVYRPAYLFNPDGTAAPRPGIVSVSATVVQVGASFSVATDSPVVAFSFIRYGSNTHTVNTDQRRIPIAASAPGTTHNITVLSDPGIALPGYWMLFALNAQGVPSVAQTMKVTL